MIVLNLKILYLLGFVFALITDFIIKIGYLGEHVKKYYETFISYNPLKRGLILLLIFYLIFCIYYILDLNIIHITNDHPYLNTDNNIFSSMSESSNSGSGSVGSSTNNVDVKNNVHGRVEKGEVNINHPLLNISVPAESLNNIASALSTSGGYQMAKVVGGSPALKAAVALGTFATCQASTAVMSKILNKKNDDDDDKKNKFTNIIFNDTDYEDKYNKYPLNLLPEMNQLINIELFFTLIIINIMIVRKLISLNIDFNKYLPNNKAGHFIYKIIQRYIKIWSTTSSIILAISSICMITCILVSKLCIFSILNN